MVTMTPSMSMGGSATATGGSAQFTGAAKKNGVMGVVVLGGAFAALML
jgi:hypothetical protein